MSSVILADEQVDVAAAAVRAQLLDVIDAARHSTEKGSGPLDRADVGDHLRSAVALLDVLRHLAGDG